MQVGSQDRANRRLAAILSADVTAAMAAGVTDRRWSVEDIVRVIEGGEALEDGSVLVG